MQGMLLMESWHRVHSEHEQTVAIGEGPRHPNSLAEPQGRSCHLWGAAPQPWARSKVCSELLAASPALGEILSDAFQPWAMGRSVPRL